MEPLNITITDLTLNTVMDADYDGGRTLGDSIVSAAVAKMAKDSGEWSETYRTLNARVSQIRDDEIRKLVTAEIEAVMAQPVYATNQWGERVTGKETTLLALIVAEAEKFFTEKKSEDRYGNGPKLTGAERAIAAMIKEHLTKELAAIFADEKAKLIKAIQGTAAGLIAQAVKDGLQ